MSNSSSNITIFDVSRMVLRAQTTSNIVVGTLCALSIVTGSLQILVTIFWKPLRKAELSLIFAIAICDWLSTASFGALTIRRLYETIMGADDVDTQRNCMIWLCFIVAHYCTLSALIVAVSAERLLRLASPTWYKVQRMEFRLYLIAISVIVGFSTGGGLFIGVSPTSLLPACAIGSSPTETYRTFNNADTVGTACLTLAVNVVSCAFLIGRWRKAVKAKKDMKTFKKSVRFGALKMLLIVVSFYLLSSTMGSVWIAIINSDGWDDRMRMSYSPLATCFELTRSALDFPCLVIMVKEYRNGFKSVILKKFF